MTCPNCESETYSYQIFYTKNGKLFQCKYCPEKYTPKGMNSNVPNSAVYGGVTKNGKFYPQSAAYHHEVSRRRRDSDGYNYIDRGRKSFSV